MARSLEGLCDLNLSASSWSEDIELEDQCYGLGSSPTYAAAASKSPTVPAATAEPAEEGAELLYQLQQTSGPWYCHFCHCSNHPLRELCTMRLESKKLSLHGRSPPCGSDLCLIFILMKLSKHFVYLV